MSDECLNSDQKNYIDMSIKVVETRLDGMDRAATLKAEEIDRRLEEHNKLREEVMTDRSVFVRTETYSLHEKSANEWKTEVNRSLTKLMTKYENRMSMANWIAVVAVAVTIINLIVLIFHFDN
jgi:hypothetical protein